MTDSRAELTNLLQAWSQGDPRALELLAPLIVEDLRRMARRHLRGDRAARSLQPTDLVNQVYLRLVDQRHTDWQNREHFFAVASRIMRWVLTDRAKAQSAEKRGKDAIKVSLRVALEVAQDPGTDHSALYEALDRLREIDPRQADIVELHYFFGLEHKEIAEKLDISVTTSKRELRTAKAWLYRELTRQ
jgi:RNA polymerase sigma factor (TIGR02999 family)